MIKDRATINTAIINFFQVGFSFKNKILKKKTNIGVIFHNVTETQAFQTHIA